MTRPIHPVRRDPFLCVSKYHRGDRVIDDPLSRFEARLEYRRVDGRHRPHVIKLRNVCGACMQQEVHALQPHQEKGEQGGLFE